jgi:hypothetical protein
MLAGIIRRILERDRFAQCRCGHRKETREGGNVASPVVYNTAKSSPQLPQHACEDQWMAKIHHTVLILVGYGRYGDDQHFRF